MSSALLLVSVRSTGLLPSLSLGTAGAASLACSGSPLLRVAIMRDIHVSDAPTAMATAKATAARRVDTGRHC